MSGSRVVTVAAERLPGWLDRFAASHGALDTTITPYDGPAPQEVTVRAADGSQARLEVPFPPLPPGPVLTTLSLHCRADRTLGLVLVRRGGYAVGRAQGARLAESKVGTRYVQSRTAAGGWSQQRYARRRANQADELLDAVVEHARRILLAHRLDAVVGGGDRLLIDAVRADPRLAPLAPRWQTRRLEVPDPRLAVLEAAVTQARAVRISLTDP